MIDSTRNIAQRRPKPRRASRQGAVGRSGRSAAWTLAVSAVAVLTLSGAPAAHADAPLRVCADPNALPFSNHDGQGFENRLARLLAADWGQTLEYTWWAERRGFFRNTLKARRCDVVMGVPVGLEMLATTAPYYRASYAFVWRRERAYGIDSFDDPRLRTLRVGVELVGDDGVNSPPVHALTRRGIVDNVVGYSVFGDYADPAPLAAAVRAVDAGDVDVAIVWGPVAGYFARRAEHELEVAPIAAAVDGGIPQSFAVAFGVRRGDDELRRRLDAFLTRRAPEIRRLLAEYGFDAGMVAR